MRDSGAKNANTASQFINRHKLAGAMSDANVTRAENDGFGSKCNHAGRFRAECNGAWSFS